MEQFKTKLPESSPTTDKHKSKIFNRVTYVFVVEFIIRVFDGDLCETKQEAFQKYQEKKSKSVRKRFGGGVKRLFGT